MKILIMEDLAALPEIPIGVTPAVRREKRDRTTAAVVDPKPLFKGSQSSLHDHAPHRVFVPASALASSAVMRSSMALVSWTAIIARATLAAAFAWPGV